MTSPLRVCALAGSAAALALLACDAHGRSDAQAEAVAPLSKDLTDTLRKTPPLDFFVEDVCLDAKGKVVMDVGPLDPSCASHRDLAPGERLPYHKIAYPGASWVAKHGADPGATTRWDNVPIKAIHAVGGVGAITIGDNDSGDGFWTPPDSKDTIHGPDFVSDRTVWRAFAIDHSGPYRNVSPSCTGWTTDPLAALDGNPQAVLEHGHFSGEGSGVFDKLATQYVDDREKCPESFGGSDARVVWRFEMDRYSTGLVEQDLTPPLLTLYMVNEVAVDASHVEPVFNTRELGQVLHQSWDNLARAGSKKERDELVAAERKIRTEHLCDAPSPKPPFDLDGFTQGHDELGPTNVWTAPDGKNAWALVSCRVVTTAVPAHDPVKGDDPSVWQEALARFELSAPLVGAPLPPRPSVHDAKTSGSGTLVVSGTRFSPTGNSVLFGERGCTVNDLPSKPAKAKGERTIELTVPSCAHGEAVQVQVWNGRAMSVDDVTYGG